MNDAQQYTLRRGVGIAVSVIAAMLALIVAADPASLGLTHTAVAWIAIINGGLTVLQNFLPQATKAPGDVRGDSTQ